MKPLRLLVVADSNNPDWSSVPLVSHYHSTALSHLNQVTLVTHESNRKGIEGKPHRYREVAFVSMPWLDALIDWIFVHVFKGDFGSQALTLTRVPFYLAFEFRVWRMFRKRLAAREFDAVLRLTPVSPAMPSLLSSRLRRLRVPFVVGPINGGLPWPPGFQQASRDREWIGRFRTLYRFLPYMRSTYRDAAAVLVGSSRTWDEQQAQRDRLFFIPENGILESSLAKVEPRPARQRLELLFVGRLVPLKACDIALEAAAPLIRDGRAQLTVVGTGREREALEALTDSLGIRHGVVFTGELKHAQVMEHFLRADALVFPSIRDFGGGVVFEALSSGCIPVVSNYGGPADIVTEDTGIKVPLIDAARTRDAFTQALERLHADPALRVRLSAAGQAYARGTLTWSGKARLTTSVLAWAAGLGPRPEGLVPPRLNEGG